MLLKQLTVVKGEKEVEYQSPGACPGSCSEENFLHSFRQGCPPEMRL